MWSFFTENNQMRHIVYRDNTLQWVRLDEVKKRWIFLFLRFVFFLLFFRSFLVPKRKSESNQDNYGRMERGRERERASIMNVHKWYESVGVVEMVVVRRHVAFCVRHDEHMHGTRRCGVAHSKLVTCRNQIENKCYNQRANDRQTSRDSSAAQITDADAYSI